MSGYSDGLRTTVPTDSQDIGFVEKPFTATGVLRRIHDLLTPGQVSTLVDAGS